MAPLIPVTSPDDLLRFAGQRARLDLNEGGVLNQRRCLDAMLLKDFDDFLRIVHRRFHVREDVEMGLPAHDVLLNILPEARHDGIDDEKDGDAKRRPEDGEQRDEGDERPFGTQISQSQKDVERKMHGVYYI